MNPGFAGFELMKETGDKLEPTDSLATITFVRGQTFLSKSRFGIWGDDGYLGSLGGRMQFEIQVRR